MPSLIRFLFTIGVFAGLVYGAMYALVIYVEPSPREMTERVSTDKINPVRQAPVPAPAVDLDEATPQPTSN